VQFFFGSTAFGGGPVWAADRAPIQSSWRGWVHSVIAVSPTGATGDVGSPFNANLHIPGSSSNSVMPLLLETV